MARGFFDDDKEWDLAIEEAALTAYPKQLRELFVMILVNNTPTNAADLWEKYKERFSEDIWYRSTTKQERLENNANCVRQREIAHNRALLKIQDQLTLHGCRLSDFGLPAALADDMYEEDVPLDLKAELNYDRSVCKKAWEKARDLMANNDGQRALFDELRRLIDNGNPEGKYYFVDGPGGTGKTTLFNALLNYVRAMEPDRKGGVLKKQIAVAVAASGIAALLLRGGRTAHNRFGLGINVHETTNCHYSKQYRCARYQILKRAKLIIWDEATMSSKLIVHAVDRALRDIMGNDRPFGGKLVIFGGDFRQTLGIVDGGNRAVEVNNCLKMSPLWAAMEKRKLTRNMRVETNMDAENRERLRTWSNMLLEIGEGRCKVSEAAKNHFYQPDVIPLPENIISDAQTPQELLQNIYPTLENATDLDTLQKSAILAPKNADVDLLNRLALNRVPGEERYLYSEDSVAEDGRSQSLPEEYLNGIHLSGLPAHKLVLKTGVPVMLLRNLAPLKGMYLKLLNSLR